ncbi:hypothetical protein [Polyangium jinanense]|uniref:Uncharacterized protein n=1 Tax=Polyangium jinanense TaxID=2829994 RepID=A0A9X3X3N0_9BACT|nr:hypothetical protein [Polyangium jinanense]MDC3956138.1 hypothetical protein [Polyangium jinanense]MDC3983027.1 hypothetical protein [Polyangium jinanense]
MKSKDDRQSIERPLGRVVLSCLGIALASLAVACAGGSNNNPTGGGGEGGDGSGAAGGGGSGGAGGEGGEGGGAIVYPVAPEEVVKFNPALGELPEGIAIDGTTAYVSYSVNPKVVKLDLETGAVTDYGTIPGPVGLAFPQGVGIDANKNVYVVVKSESPQQFQAGVYKFPPGGGEATWVPGTETLTYPRAITFASFGSGFVSNPVAASFTEIQPGDAVGSEIGPSKEFSGDQMSACAYGEMIPRGITSVVASGTSMADASFFWTNADRATIYQGGFVPAGGGAVTFQLGGAIAGPDCALLGGVESLIEDPVDVSLLVVARAAHKIVRVQFTGETQVLSEGEGFYEPSAIAIGKTSKGRFLYITNSAHTTYNKGGIPGVVRIPLPDAK